MKLVYVGLNKHAILYMERIFVAKPIDLNDIAYVSKLLGWAICCAKDTLFLLTIKRTLTLSHRVILIMNTKHYSYKEVMHTQFGNINHLI